MDVEIGGAGPGMGLVSTGSGGGVADPSDDAWLAQYYTPEKATASGDAGDPHPLDLTVQPAGKYGEPDLLGAGAEKEVARVRDRDTLRDVALARPTAGRSGAAFVREARILARLEHPNIVPVHDLGLAPDGRPYFTMKLLTGETLDAVLVRLRAGDAATAARYPLPALLDVFARVCDAIAFAHSRGVIHRDIKPANVRIGEYGEVRVLDWGLARSADDLRGGTARGSRVAVPAAGESADEPRPPGDVRGTPGYMAPEQAAGRGDETDERTDVYALGALLYALLTWRPPVEGSSTDEVLRRTVAGEVAPLRRPSPDRTIPGALEAIARKALAVQPGDRYPTVEALRADLRAFTQGYATSAEEAGPIKLLWLVVKRHRALSLVTSLSALAVVGLTVAAVARIRASERVAVAALNDLRAEHAVRGRLITAAVPQYLNEARGRLKALEYDAALETLRTAIGLDPSQAEAWDLTGCIYLGLERFDEALAAFHHEYQALLAKPAAAPAAGAAREKTGPRGTAARPPKKDKPAKPDPEIMFAEAGLRLAGRERRPLKAAEFQQLVSDMRVGGAKSLRDSRTILGAYFQRRNASGWTDPEHRAFVQWAVRELNGGRADLELTATVTGLEARVSGATASDLLPLTRLPLARLDLRGTSVKDLTPLADMPLQSLDVSGTPVSNFDPLIGVPLRELVAEGVRRLPADLFEFCPDLETVVVSPTTDLPHHAAWPDRITVVRR
jgi:tetratricopeptide (TPR) repeat protein